VCRPHAALRTHARLRRDGPSKRSLSTRANWPGHVDPTRSQKGRSHGSDLLSVADAVRRVSRRSRRSQANLAPPRAHGSRNTSRRTETHSRTRSCSRVSGANADRKSAQAADTGNLLRQDSGCTRCYNGGLLDLELRLSAFEDVAALVHQQHRLISCVETWRECRQLLCQGPSLRRRISTQRSRDSWGSASDVAPTSEGYSVSASCVVRGERWSFAGAGARSALSRSAR
jgi:hypothetical protein